MPVVDGRAVYEFVAVSPGSVIEGHGNQIEVHLDLGAEQIMGAIVDLLLRQPVSRALWVVYMRPVHAAGDPQRLHRGVTLAPRRRQGTVP